MILKTPTKIVIHLKDNLFTSDYLNVFFYLLYSYEIVYTQIM